MAIRTRDDSVLVLLMIVQVRYAQGYKFLGGAGEVLNRVEVDIPDWKPTRVGTLLANLEHRSSPIVANFGHKALDLAYNGKVKLTEAGKAVRELADAAETFYRLVREYMEVGKAQRVGARFHFFAPADSVEEADRTICRLAKSDYLTETASRLRHELIDAETQFVFEDPESGIRRTFRTSSRFLADRPGAVEHFGFREDALNEAGGLMVDVDSYTRPQGGHFEKLSQFVQEEFVKVSNATSDLLRWIIKPR